MDTADRILDEIFAALRQKSDLVRAAELRLNPAIRNAVACYRKALKDADTKLPTYLHGALEQLATLVPPPAPKAAWERDQQGTYDMSPRGGQLRPGS